MELLELINENERSSESLFDSPSQILGGSVRRLCFDTWQIFEPTGETSCNINVVLHQRVYRAAYRTAGQRSLSPD